MTWDWSTYFYDYGQENSKYLKVNPQVAVVLLEKVREADKKKNIFSALKKNQRDKKKLVETFLKQLRQLTSNSDQYNCTLFFTLLHILVSYNYWLDGKYPFSFLCV
ncbi:exocyst complex component 6-like isoform X4 [Tachypleus tridentatus]